MRIALDATPLTVRHGGIPRYVTELARALAENRPDDEIHLLSDQPNLHIDPGLAALANVETTPPRGPRFFGKWWSLGLPWELRRRGIEVFHGADFAVPYLPAAPSVMTLHDLSPWKEPELRPPGSERVRNRTPRLLGLARGIITPSEAVRQEALEHFGLAPDRVRAIAHGADSRILPADDQTVNEALTRHQIGRPYLCYVGATNRRKNLPTLLAAWRAARARHPRLELVLNVSAGWRDDLAPFLTETEDGLKIIEQIEDRELAALLSGAAVFVYPSHYEGFGLPILEAMQAGAPVIASADAALRETAAGAAVHVEARSVEQWRRRIEQLVGDHALADDYRSRGFARASQLSWRLTAERTREAYEHAIRRP